MFRSIVVPLDGTPQSAAALPAACAIARASGGCLHLVQVVPAGDHHAAVAASLRLDPIAHEASGSGVHVNVHMRSGDPAAAIVTAARELDADLIVMATHARGNRSVLALTSVSRAVVSQSQVPVLLVRPGARGTQRIRTLLVPVDGSPGGSLALAAAIAMAHTMQARLVLLQVVVPLNADEVAALPGMTLGGFIDPAWGNLAVAGAEAYVHKLADHLTAGGLVCEAHVAVGEVAPEIVRCSTDVGADLVVMSTHARTWPGEALVGSVALNVLEYGELPLLLVHREPPAGEVIAESETPSMLASTISGGH